MDIKGKTKDNLNARRDLKIICNCPELELDERRSNLIPKAVYTLSKEQKRRIFEWIRGLKDARIQVSIFNYPGWVCGASKKIWVSGPERHIIETYILTNCEVIPERTVPAPPFCKDPIIDRLVSTEFKDWFKQCIHPELKYKDNELLKCHYWGPKAEVTLVSSYFVNGYNFQIEHHNHGKLAMNYGVCVKSSSYTDNDNDFYGIIEEIIQLTYPLIPNLHIVLFKCRWRIVDESKWIEIAYQPEEVIPALEVATDNQLYDLHDSTDLQIVVDLSIAHQQVVGISWTGASQTDDEDEDNFEDYETDDDDYEAT
ncbi:UNVERIFIED_CONTAM: hypothetical protein Sindi_2030500 [Sesamum indicum]